MTVEELKTELESIVLSLMSSGFGTINPGTMEKLKVLTTEAGKLNMKEGKRLIKNLTAAMRAIKTGKSKAESGSVRLTALDFYLKKLSSGGNIEDL